MQEAIRVTTSNETANVTCASENTTVTLESDIEAPPSREYGKDMTNVSNLRHLSEDAVGLTSLYLNPYIPQALTAAILLSAASLIIKVLSDELSVFHISFICSSLSAIIIGIMWLHTGVSFAEFRTNALTTVLGGIFAAGAFLTSAVAVTLLPLSEFAFMSNSFPVVTAVLSWLFGMEQLGLVSWIGAIGCLGGNALLAGPPFLFGESGDWGSSRIGGIACAASANILFGLSFIILRYLGTSVNSKAMAVMIHGIVAIASIPFIAIGYPKQATFATSWQNDVLLLCIAVSAVMIHCTLSRAFEGGSTSKPTEALMTNMLISCAFGVILLSEGMTWTALIGDAIIMVSVLFVVTRNSLEDEFQHDTGFTHRREITESAA